MSIVPKLGTAWVERRFHHHAKHVVIACFVPAFQLHPCPTMAPQNEAGYHHLSM